MRRSASRDLATGASSRGLRRRRTSSRPSSSERTAPAPARCSWSTESRLRFARALQGLARRPVAVADAGVTRFPFPVRELRVLQLLQRTDGAFVVELREASRRGDPGRALVVVRERDQTIETALVTLLRGSGVARRRAAERLLRLGDTPRVVALDGEVGGLPVLELELRGRKIAARHGALDRITAQRGGGEDAQTEAGEDDGPRGRTSIPGRKTAPRGHGQSGNTTPGGDDRGEDL